MKLKKGQRFVYTQQEIKEIFKTLKYDVEQLTDTESPDFTYHLQLVRDNLKLLKYAVTGEPKC